MQTSSSHDTKTVEKPHVCYQCDEYVSYLYHDARCIVCTRITPEEMRGEDPSFNV